MRSIPKEKMFEAPRYVLKDGELVIEDHEFAAITRAGSLRVARLRS
jgi:hypothetical protein